MELKLKKRNLAIVLLDIIGSTRFVQRYGSLVAATHFQYHDRLARSLIYKFEGREIDRSDGFLCSFDRPVDAVNFALRYQATVPQKTKLQCRIGIHWGSIIEVEQEDVYVAANAKRIELEGLAKNIAARTMSLCSSGQVILTREAMLAVKGRTNYMTPRSTRYACIGLYKFKGVREPQILYAVGESIESLQPPKGNDKVRRVGGSKKIKSRMRDRNIKEWFWWLLWRLLGLEFAIVTYYWFKFVSVPYNRTIWGIQYFDWVDWVTETWRLIING